MLSQRKVSSSSGPKVPPLGDGKMDESKGDGAVAGSLEREGSGRTGSGSSSWPHTRTRTSRRVLSAAPLIPSVVAHAHETLGLHDCRVVGTIRTTAG